MTTATIRVSGTAGTGWYPAGRILAEWSAEAGVTTATNPSAPGGVAITNWSPARNLSGQNLDLNVTSATPPGFGTVDGVKAVRFSGASWIGSPLFTTPLRAPMTIIIALLDTSSSNQAFHFTGYNPGALTGFVSLQQRKATPASNVSGAVFSGPSAGVGAPIINAWYLEAVTVNADGMFVVANDGTVASSSGATSGGVLNGITLGGPSSRANTGNWAGRIRGIRILAGEMSPETTKFHMAEFRSAHEV